jgi:hypothetical protein
LIRKEFKYMHIGEGREEERVCPICCEEMERAVKMTCDERHLFHKKCI